MTELPPEDRAPDFPPGPQGPEDDTPGAQLLLSTQQIEDLAAFARTHSYSTVVLEDRGAAYVEARLLDAEGRVTAEKLLMAHGPS